MTAPLRPPAIRFKGRTFTSDELAARAAAWSAHVAAAMAPAPPLVAVPMANHPDSVALFFALTAGASSVLLLPEDPRAWGTAPPIPPGTPMILTPGQHALAEPAAAAGLRPFVVPEIAAGSPAAPEPRFFALPGLVLLTSGTTGLPKPVYKPTANAIRSAVGNAELQRTPRGAGVIGVLPLHVNYGINASVMVATVVGGTLALLDRFDHRSVLGLFASREYYYCALTPLMADLLTRCPLDGPAPPAPPVVISSAGQLPPAVYRAFKARFGVAPRSHYGATEANAVAAVGPDDPEQMESVGRPLPGIEVRIGDDPRVPAPRGTAGRIWYSSPWYMLGYGFPGAIEPREEIDGWFPTSDLGMLDAAGYLTLLGRGDDCFKTSAGHLVNPAVMALALREHPTVVDVAVVPLTRPAGTVIGVLVEADGGFDAAGLWSHASSRLPAPSQPEVIVAVPALPRFASGKIDRAACVELLLERAGG